MSIMKEGSLEIPVEGYLIQGLPKTSKVPKAFFENAYSNVQKCSDGSYSISFSVRGLGGWKPKQIQFTTSNSETLIFKSLFDRNFDSLNKKQGLYVFISDAANQGRYAYVGESGDLGDRLKNHDDQPINSNDWVYVHVLHGNTSQDTRKSIEAEMIQKLCPTRNTQHATHC
jgi:hypothetical protein